MQSKTIKFLIYVLILLLCWLVSRMIDIDVEYKGKAIKCLTMHQPVPSFGSALQNRGQAARALGMKPFEILGVIA